MRRINLFLLCVCLVIGLFSVIGHAQETYKKPPKEIQEILDAPAIPSTSISPAKDLIAVLVPLRYPPISELAQPMLRLAGTRVNPRNNGAHREPYFIQLTLKKISDGSEMHVKLPAGAKIIRPQWSPDGRYIAAGNITDNGIELWFIDTRTGAASKVQNVYLNTAFGGFDWTGPRTIL
ncbi:MAG TPA: hypothetical protein VNK26_00515, partial [Pyrinomonadaceae bacterium]|nr:hypothetical protein [Pyrinomonadaceae bacterium]